MVHCSMVSMTLTVALLELTLVREKRKRSRKNTAGRSVDGHGTGGVLWISGDQESPDALKDEEEPISTNISEVARRLEIQRRHTRR